MNSYNYSLVSAFITTLILQYTCGLHIIFVVLIIMSVYADYRKYIMNSV